MIRSRRPSAAGLFYPSQPALLLSTVQSLMEPAAHAPAIAALVPHGGYVYSGRTLGLAIGRVDIPRRVIVLAPNHTGAGKSSHGGSVYAVGGFQTPLGEVPVDEMLAADLLARCTLLEDDPDAHRTEHAIEVLLPFLFARRPDVTFVPIMIGWSDWRHTRTLAEALADAVRASAEPVLVIASTDLSHYETAEAGRVKDERALAVIASLDGEALLEVTRKERITMCGRVPAAAVLHATRLLGATRAELVDYSHSGMATGDNSSVVGYAGVIIT